MTNHWSQDIARPQTETTDRQRVSPRGNSFTDVLPYRPLRPVDDEWTKTIEAAIVGPYRGSSPARRRRGRAKCPTSLVRGHVCGHQCTAISPRLLAIWGGKQAACRRLCRVQLDPRRDDNDSPYAGVQCWITREAWLESIGSTFDRRYRSIRPILVKKRAGAKNSGGGVTKKTFLKVATVMAAAANSGTGRECRLTNASIAERSGVSVTQVTRVRLAMLLMGVATEVLRGRQRTYAERMASWRVGDRARGWASVWALHPAREAVDNSVVRRDGVYPGQDKMATHPARGHFSLRKVTSSGSNLATGCGKRGASRRNEKQAARRKAGAAPQKALILALKWLADARTPLWAQRNRADAWAVVLAPAAEHGWTADDLNDELRAVEVRHPLAYVRGMLAKVDLPFPRHIVREIEVQRAVQAQATIDAAVEEAVTEVKQAVRARADEALGGEGRRSALAQASAIGEASENRRKAGEQFDHRAHWRRLAHGR
ncbi:replication protein [Nocardia africana]|uniref:Replication protein n=1 Tax=Nocardia africana TaxID=134964 RepID=A0A379X4R3_9NOCA|nr:replication protein [Nocardia africana]MCC3318415.1 replication protein [Nocardia africana]SUH71852.1 Uncharacterised protein [Nocardia africana]